MGAWLYSVAKDHKPINRTVLLIDMWLRRANTVYMYVCMYICKMRACVRACVRACMHACMHACMYVCMDCGCAVRRLCPNMSLQQVHARIYLYVYLCGALLNIQRVRRRRKTIVIRFTSVSKIYF